MRTGKGTRRVSGGELEGDRALHPQSGEEVSAAPEEDERGREDRT
jgi:hypothetical protein